MRGGYSGYTYYGYTYYDYAYYGYTYYDAPSLEQVQPAAVVDLAQDAVNLV